MKNLPTTLYRAEQIRTLERHVIGQGELSSFDLMTQAGHEVFCCLKATYPEAKVIAVLCGAGNNGGDGYIVAHLAAAAGLTVTVYALSAPEVQQDEALMAYRQCIDSESIDIVPFVADQVLVADVIIDALLGSGLNRPVTGLYAAAIEQINAASAAVIAVDIPSGLHADTGNSMACTVKADYTVTFIGLKQGLFTGQAAEYCGAIVYAELAVPAAILHSVSASAVRVESIALPPRQRCAHKGHYGHVLIIGGACGFSGAVLLAGEATLRTGAGLVSIATRLEHASTLNINRPELMCHGVENAWQLLALLAKASVVVIGPGLGQSDWAKELFAVTVASGKPLIIDADGLTLLALDPMTKADLILTPHPAEAARLLNCTTADIQQDRFAAARAMQSKYQGIAVLKGAGTLIASADDIAVSTTGNPGMASGGMGDVLAGVIASLLAQGLTLKQAAQQGVYRHGLAADLAAKASGERGLLARDLMPYLQQLVN